jgi:uncharacterized repeat protein (TIGR03943 family)
VSAAGGAISLLLGAVLLRLSVTDDYQRYVRAGLGPYLVLAGIVVVGLGLVTLVQALRHEPLADDLDEDDGHGGIGVGWLLLAPIAALLLVAPPTLGSYGVDRGATVDVRAGAPVFDPLEQGGAPVALSLFEFGQRTFDHGGASFNGVPVQLTGFVAGADSDGFRLARYQIACCAADAAPVVVDVVGTAGETPARDQWVRVIGRFRRPAGDVPVLAATSVAEIDAPVDPYE